MQQLKFNFKYKFSSKSIFFALLLAIGPAAASMAAIKPVFEIMHHMKSCHLMMEQRISDGLLDAELERSIKEMEMWIVELRSAYRSYYGGSPEAWETLCAKSLETLVEFHRVVQRGDLEKAREALGHLNQIQEESHRNFRPGIFKKITRIFFRKRFSSH